MLANSKLWFILVARQCRFMDAILENRSELCQKLVRYVGLSLPRVCTLVQQHLQLESDVLRGAHEESRVPCVTLLKNAQTESLQPCREKEREIQLKETKVTRQSSMMW